MTTMTTNHSDNGIALLASTRLPLNITAEYMPTATGPASRQPWAIEIWRKYGDAARVCRMFGIDRQRYCAENNEKALTIGVPTFAQMLKVYGDKSIMGLIQAHVTDCVIKMGESKDVTDRDCENIVIGICSNSQLRTLNFATVIGFFHRLKAGMYTIYGAVTPRKVAEAFNAYAEEMQAWEQRTYQRIEEQRRREYREKAAKEGCTWEDYARRHGIAAASPSEYLAQCREWCDALAGIVGFFSILTEAVTADEERTRETPITTALK